MPEEAARPAATPGSRSQAFPARAAVRGAAESGPDAYEDRDDPDALAAMLAPRLAAIRGRMTAGATLYLHLDHRAVHEVKVAADLPKGAFRLTWVDLNHNVKVSDAGLVHFKDCKNLTVLRLAATQVTDAGLAHFKDCKNLTYLDLRKTKVTAAKIEELKKALPAA